MSLGNFFSFVSQYFSGRPRWGVDSIPDLSGKVAIVTGGSSGIGKEIAKGLLSHNATVYIATRSVKNAQQAIAELEDATGKTAIFISLDLAELSSVKAAAERFMSSGAEEVILPHLHILFNNGGIMFPPVEQITSAGYDLSFGTNVLGHFYLTKLLLPTLLASFAETGEKARVVNLSSGATYVAMYDFKTLKDCPERRKLSLTDLYGQSKVANIFFAEELARRYGDQGIVSTSLNPGNLKTNLSRYAKGGVEAFALYFMQTYSAEWGALTPLYAGTSPEGADFNGKFLIPWARLGKAREFDPKLAPQLWDWMEEEVKSI